MLEAFFSVRWCVCERRNGGGGVPETYGEDRRLAGSRVCVADQGSEDTI